MELAFHSVCLLYSVVAHSDDLCTCMSTIFQRDCICGIREKNYFFNFKGFFVGFLNLMRKSNFWNKLGCETHIKKLWNTMGNETDFLTINKNLNQSEIVSINPNYKQQIKKV